MNKSREPRTYARSESVVFLKTKDAFGGLSNMAGGFPLCVNGIRCRTSEALYQACRFPHIPEAQRLILAEHSPMTAKMKSKPFRHESRTDWNQVRVKIMRWCLRVKLVQNWNAFSTLLLETGDLPIVEESRKDDFWGAKSTNSETLVGMNVLGRLLMELREEIKTHERSAFRVVPPLSIPQFLLDGHEIEAVRDNISESDGTPYESSSKPTQSGLFERPVVNDVAARYVPESDAAVSMAEIEGYEGTKDSGVPWLGLVPAHWDVLPALAVYKERGEKNVGMTEKTVLSLSYGRIVVKPEEKLRGLVPESFETYQIVEPGNIIVRTTDLQNDQKSLRVGHAKDRGIITSAYMCLATTDKVDNEFGYQYLNAYDLLKIIYGYGSGLRQNLDFKDIKRMPVLVPPKDEQAAIVRFLDHADRRIRRYIRAKQKLIKLLEEQKQAIIHRAVTRGLDPDVRLKASGVGWLGDVPEHWEVARAGTVCGFASAKAHEKFVEPDGEHLCVTAKFVSTGGRSFRRCTRNLSPAQRGDVLMVMSDLPRGRALARAYLVDDDRSYAVNQRVCILRPVNVHPKFLVFAANRHPELLAHDDGFNQTHLPNSAFKIMRLPLPPSEEQAKIANFLVYSTSTITSSIERSSQEIDLLHEYRTRLIADVVTGKLDVREAAARLPDEIDEPETPGDAEGEGDADMDATDDLDTEVEAEAEA